MMAPYQKKHPHLGVALLSHLLEQNNVTASKILFANKRASSWLFQMGEKTQPLMNCVDVLGHDAWKKVEK